MGLSLQLILQWSIGVLVLIRCFLKRRQFTLDIESKLGSSFSWVPFVIVVGSCTFLAMVATLPLSQLFFFHLLLIKKGISTYDYIIALREQEQLGVGGQQSPQMSTISSLTGLSSASSFTNFHRGAWCTPPRLFLDDQFDFIPPDVGVSSDSTGKKVVIEESSGKRNPGTVKISPWTLARLNAEEVSKAAAEAKKKSRVLQPVMRREKAPVQGRVGSFGRGKGQKLPTDNRTKTNKRGRLDFPPEPLTKISTSATDSNGGDHAPETSTSLAPLQLVARNAFHTSRAMSSTGIIASSPDSSFGSPDLHPFRVSSSGAEEARGRTSFPPIGSASQKGVQLSRSTSDGYEASGGEDSDRVPSRIVHRSSNWNKLLNSSNRETADELKMSSSAGLQARVGPF
uniref:Putative S-acyltransferase At1g69420 n=1 Tax=Anthurium amnicola TaxID=1678845 RepID=A0A1D1XYP5_9ARAE